MHTRGDITLSWAASAIVMALITATTIIGNAVMLIAVRRAKRAPAHFALRSLLAADLLVGACVLPLAAARELFVFHIPWFLCAWWSTLDVLCCTASILSLCALGWERWWGITAPLAVSKRARRVKMLVAILWPASTVIALPTGFIPSQKHYWNGEVPKACTVNTNTVYVFSSISFSFYIPTSVMVFFYAMILRSLATTPSIRAHRGRSPCADGVAKENNNHNAVTAEEKVPNALVSLSPQRAHLAPPSGVSQTPQRKHHIPAAMLPSPLRAPSPLKLTSTLANIIPRQRRATQTIVMLMSLFLICWTPFFVMLPFDSICDCVSDVSWTWCTWLGYANSALNPLVYAAASPSVRRALPSSLPLKSRSTDATASGSGKQ